MPDTTPPPGDPTVLRDNNKRSSEQGDEISRRESPKAAMPRATATRARRSTVGAVARAQRVGQRRWRDIEWVDFTTTADPGVEAPLVTAPAAPTPAPESPSAPEPPLAPAPGLTHALRHFARPAAVPSETQYTSPGLAHRFTRLPTTKPVGAPQAVTSEITPLAALLKIKPGAAHPQPSPPAIPATTVVAAATAEPASLPEFRPAAEPSLTPAEATASPSRLSSFYEEDRGSFPASIYTPTSTVTLPEPLPSLGARFGQASSALRTKSDSAIAAMSNGLGQATTAVRRRIPRKPPAETLQPSEPPPPSAIPPAEAEASKPKPAPRLVHMKPTRGIDYLTARLAGAENLLRLSGTIVLAALLIALAAYAGGALIAKLAGVGVSPKQAAVSDHAVGVAQAAPPAPPPAPAPTLPSMAPNAPPMEPVERAAFYLTRAKAGDAAAQYDAGVLYARGDGLVQDYASAASWFRAAAAQGNVAAEFNLGVLYERGLGLPLDETEALNWYRSAADQNHTGAQFNLALAYAEGRGANQDFAAAARWYQRAAQQGSAPAMVNLAILYERGDGVDRSLIDAYAWYSAAGERGEADAKSRAADLMQQFNDKDQARAEGLAASIGAALDASAPPA